MRGSATIARLNLHWLTRLLTTSASIDPLAYACPNALAARATFATKTELRRLGTAGEVLLLSGACRWGCAGEDKDVVPEVNVGCVSGVMLEGFDGSDDASGDAEVASVTHSPVHSG